MNKVFPMDRVMLTFFVAFLASTVLYGQTDIVNDFDFSRCGYAGNDRPIPFVTAVCAVDPVVGDATPVIQQAIDYVSSLPMGDNGFRGAVLLNSGEHEVYGNLVISADGIVLRGSSDAVLIAAGNKRRTLIEVKGPTGPQRSKNVHDIRDALVQPGAQELTLESVEGLAIGTTIFIVRPCTEAWIQELQMDTFVGLFPWRLNWRPGSREVTWDRTITRIDGDKIFFDGPITTELDARFGPSYVVSYQWPGRIRNVGIENLTCISAYDASHPKDEEHSWICVNMANVRHGWVRDVEAIHFAGSAVMLQPSTSHITVDHCTFAEPVSEIGGLRRISFYNGGQLNLIRNCTARRGRHDFVAGFCSAGPNVFQDCHAEEALGFSGSMESWACGALFDNVTVYGNDIKLCNLKTCSQGAGYSASNCVVWNCNAAEINVENPPHSTNYIYGSCGRMIGNSEPVRPYRFYPTRSLFDAQLENRLGPEKAATVTAEAKFPVESPPPFTYDHRQKSPRSSVARQAIEIVNGRFVCNGKVFWSGHEGAEVWTGSLAPVQSRKSSPCLTRFVPGREGPGWTDNLPELADALLEQDRCMLAQRPGLWYDRRRADHQWVMRKDGNVWGPFLEMPWARSGVARAWDGLSKYDLTRFNPWYFSRIKAFADLCDQKRLLMYNEIYDNHNFIENGSHWVDFPWRPVNALQNTGFTEPPPFTRDHHNNHHYHIAIADEFYDITHSSRRQLHELYIRKYLDTFKDNVNVIHTIGFQYSGSLEFARFFFDTVIEWQDENNVKLKWSVHTGKNVTDALLSEPRYRELISIIDMRYWQYLEDGELYAPPAGQNKAFRQFRKRFPDSRRPPSTARLLYRQVREYRDVYPDKAVMAYVAGVGPAPILMAGGAYAIHSYDGMGASKGMDQFNDFVRQNLADELWQMAPDDTITSDPRNTWCLADPGKTYLIYALEGGMAEAKVPEGTYTLKWFSSQGKVLAARQDVMTDGLLSITVPKQTPAFLLVKPGR